MNNTLTFELPLPDIAAWRGGNTGRRSGPRTTTATIARTMSSQPLMSNICPRLPSAARRGSLCA